MNSFPEKRFDLKKIVIIIIGILLFSFIGNVAIIGVLRLFDIDPNILKDLGGLEQNIVEVIKWAGTLNHIIVFTLFPLLYLFYFYKRNWYNEVVQNRIDGKLIFYFLSWLLFSFPLIAYSAQLNMMIPLPEWAATIDNDAISFLTKMLKMDSFWTYLINIIVIAVIPALGEELLFRGLIQRELSSMMTNQHFVVVISSIIFGILHLQLSSFFPKFMIGLILGYAYFWTKNLWYPIIIHFINNGLQVSIAYFSADKIEEISDQDIPMVPVISLIISAILCAVIVDAILKRLNHINEGA